MFSRNPRSGGQSRLLGAKRRRQTSALRFAARLEALEDRLALSAVPIQVTTIADVVDPNDGRTSLREAIQQANGSADPATIVLPAGQYQLSAAAGELEVSNSVTIEGAGAMSTAVDGGGQIRVLHIEGADVAIALSGLSIQGGSSDGLGGGILDTAASSQLTLTDCMVNGNVASGAGGGIAEAAGTSTLTLIGCTIANNTSGGAGGGIDIASTTTTSELSNCTIYGNSATGRGGALADDSSGGTIKLVNDTIDGNSSGLFQQHAKFSLGNTIVAQNGQDVTGEFDPILDHGYGGSNLIGNADGSDSFLYALPMVLIEGIGGPQFLMPKLVGSANKPVDPRLGPLANNGGPTLSQALLPDSPAIAMGSRNGAPDFDQRGVARPDGDATDIGAYEFAPPVPVISQATSEGRWGGSQPAWVGSQTLIVDGTGFYPDSVLRLNGQTLQTYFESPTELRAIVGDLMIKGLTSFSVTVFTPGGVESNAVDVAIDTGPPSQDPPAKTPIQVPPLPVWSGPVHGGPPAQNPPASGQSPQSSTPNGDFLAALYHDLLHRAPDAQGLSFWTDFLDHGGARAQAVSALVASREYLVDEVESLFQNYLHRSADTGAADYFAAFLASGGTREQIAATLAASPEYLHAHGDSASGLVDALFQDALGRGADSASRAFFEQELSAGATRGQVAAQIFSSDEYRRDLVNDAYIRFLGRSADPAALDRFTAALGGAMPERQLIEQIAASDEFFKNASR